LSWAPVYNTRMSETSLLPERQLAFSPSLAQTIGLEEAILLHHLDGALCHHQTQLRGGYAWLSIPRSWLLETLPFWDTADLQRICHSLVDKGVLLVESQPLQHSNTLLFALNQRLAHTARKPSTQPTPPAVESRLRGAGTLPALWSPSDDMLQLLTLNHGIPRQYCEQQLEDFVLYWRERGEISHAWENKFRQHVLSRWRNHQQHEAEAFRQQQSDVIDANWQPSHDALEILTRVDISRQFIADAIPEFVLYWGERKDKPKALNASFVAHIKRQWAKFTAVMANDTDPQPISANWQPRNDVYDILGMSHIDADFARKQIAEFVMYWMERGDAQSSWNTRFLQHVKYHWAKTHHMPITGQDNGGQQTTRKAISPRARSLEQDLTDRSWAD